MITKHFELIKLTQEGMMRVLDAQEGMTFLVDSVTQNRDRRIVHIRDYRYPTSPELAYCIWSLEPDHYTIISRHTPQDMTQAKLCDLVTRIVRTDFEPHEYKRVVSSWVREVAGELAGCSEDPAQQNLVLPN